MRRYLAILLAMTMLISLVACGGKVNENKDLESSESVVYEDDRGQDGGIEKDLSSTESSEPSALPDEEPEEAEKAALSQSDENGDGVPDANEALPAEASVGSDGSSGNGNVTDKDTTSKDTQTYTDGTATGTEAGSTGIHTGPDGLMYDANGNRIVMPWDDDYVGGTEQDKMAEAENEANRQGLEDLGLIDSEPGSYQECVERGLNPYDYGYSVRDEESGHVLTREEYDNWVEAGGDPVTGEDPEGWVDPPYWFE